MGIRWYELVRLGLESVRTNLVRSLITLSIIAFGLMALIGILTAIDSVLYSLNSNFSGLGANSFSIEPRNVTMQSSRGGRIVRRGEPISYQQAASFKDKFDHQGKVALSINGSNNAVVKRDDRKSNPNVAIRGVDDNYLDVGGYDLSAGRNFNRSEINQGGHVAIVGLDLVKILFDDNTARALDQFVAVGNVKYRVVGILASKGSRMDQNEDRLVLMPLTTARRYYATQRSNYGVKVSLSNVADMSEAASEALGLMRSIRKLTVSQDNDFEITMSDGLLDILRENTFYLRVAAIAIGLITLLGAAIGLMNIMLVSVTERTREIGVRKSIGASKRSIMLQFLVEAIVICQLGGIAGIVLGILIGNVVTLLMGGTFLIPWGWITLDLILCTSVGLLAGLYPAIKAAALDPIEALRHE